MATAGTSSDDLDTTRRCDESAPYHPPCHATSRTGRENRIMSTSMPTAVDLIVRGTGAAAQSVASPCREAGWSVAIVDCRPYGGPCQLRGCAPKKVLVGVADALASS